MDASDHRLRAARAGDRAALAELARAWWPSVRRWAFLELGDAVLAEDAAQEALLRVVRSLGTYREDLPVEPWLRAIVRNAARDVRAAGSRQQPPPVDEEQPWPDRGLDLRRAADVAIAAFASLSPRQREVFDLCERRGHSPAEAAGILEIAPATARALLHQARRALRSAVADHHGAEIVALLRGAS